MSELLIKNILIPDFETLVTTPGEILIKDGVFSAVGQNIETEENVPVLDGEGMLCLPGLTDTHTHMVQTLTKGPLDDLNITEWLKKMLSVQGSLSGEEWYYGVLVGCMQAIRCGVTTINEMTYWPQIDDVVRAYNESGIRATFGLGATDIAENPQTAVVSLETWLERTDYLRQRYHGKGKLRVSVAPQGRPACTGELMTGLKEYARENGLLYHTHLAEGKRETQWVYDQTGRWEAQELYHLGVLDDRTVLAHSIWLEDFELRLLKETGAHVAHCPSTNMKISDGIPKISQMLDLGVSVTFGCDGEASSSNRDILREARLGSYLQKAVTLRPDVMPASQCYQMMTEEAASALGYENLGKIEPGYLADFSLIRVQKLSLTNRARILNNLLFAGDGHYVDTVFIEGEMMLKGGKFLHLNEGEILDKCESILRRVEEFLKELPA